MFNLLITIIIATAFFCIFFAAMAIGLIFRGRKLRGGCGSHSGGECKCTPPQKNS
jgi:hypothetical protein